MVSGRPGQRDAWEPDGAGHRAHPLRGGQFMLVKASITLFVLGASFLLGGLKHHGAGIQSDREPGPARLVSSRIPCIHLGRASPPEYADDSRRHESIQEKLGPPCRRLRTNRAPFPVDREVHPSARFRLPGAHLYEHIAHAEAQACRCDLRGVSDPQIPADTRCGAY